MSNKHILDLLDVCLEYNAKEDFTVFVRFSGHIDAIEVSVYKFGWKREGGNRFTTSIDVDTKAKTLKSHSKICIEVAEKIKELYESSRAEIKRIKEDAEYAKQQRKEELLKELKELDNGH